MSSNKWPVLTGDEVAKRIRAARIRREFRRQSIRAYLTRLRQLQEQANADRPATNLPASSDDDL